MGISRSRLLLLLGALSLTTALHAQSVEQPTGSSTEIAGFSPSLPDGVPDTAFAGSRQVEILALQVMLDRSRHSPGVIDGYIGGNTRRAIRRYRAAQGLSAGEAIDEQLISALLQAQGGEIFRSYTIGPEDLDRRFRKVPPSMKEMARMERVGWESPLEMLAERFHMDQELLAALNPKADFSRAGTQITVVSHGGEKIDGKPAKIEVRKGDSSVVVLNSAGEVLASYPATVGSERFPSPNGRMQVKAVAPEANYTFDPTGREWGPDETLVIPAGPNNPVGGIWIDLTKEGYGIHGSPDPRLIGKTDSHGCVRLANWDARELASAVSTGVEVVFV